MLRRPLQRLGLWMVQFRDTRLASVAEQFRVEIVALIGSVLVHFKRDAVSIRPCVLPDAGHLPGDLHVGPVGMDAEGVIRNLGGDPCLCLLADRGELVAEIAVQRFEPIRQGNHRVTVTYDRFSFFGFGTGQPEVVTANIPVSPPFLSSADFSAPIVIWPEEASYENEGVYPALAYNPSTGADDIYVAWERNWFTNQFNGDPYVYIQAAVIPMGATTPLLGGPNAPIIVTLNQANSNVNGGVKSLDLVPVTGYNRGTSNDFPRLAWDGASDRIVFAWNDASHHPLGDIFMRAYGSRFSSTGPIEKVNDDNTGALHMFPAVCVRTDGSIVTSWYDRRNYTPGSGLTDYYGEIRTSPATNGTDFKITNAPSNWVNDSSIIIPNFGDYTDNTCDGTNTFYTWSDGRLGIPQPFVAHN